MSPIPVFAKILMSGVSAPSSSPAESKTGLSGMPEPANTDLAMGISETFLDLAGHHLVTSGAMCMGVGTSLIEIPAGTMDKGVESPEECVQRELAEEAGVVARRWDKLGEYFSSPGVFNEVVHLFLATDLEFVPSATEAAEVLEVHWWPLELACDRAVNGELRDLAHRLDIPSEQRIDAFPQLIATEVGRILKRKRISGGAEKIAQPIRDQLVGHIQSDDPITALRALADTLIAARLFADARNLAKWEEPA
ncbi:MAG: NUDIX hydrolase [Syntrophobacteraceae bacterium]|nr:NUDIX hydrolase [Syntrophobacteraceae bacterium]